VGGISDFLCKADAISEGQLGLVFGAVDLICTPSGDHVFLELNPCGEFFWLERTPGLPISDAIANLLLEHSARG
jgi:hypothetical protein